VTRGAKLGAVLAGYLAALLAAGAAAYVRLLLVPNDQASGGMQAFGDLLFFLGILGILALVPTAVGLFWLRPIGKFWLVFSFAALALAATGPVAALTMKSDHAGWVALDLLGVPRVLGTPLFALAFLISASFAPTRFSRRLLLTASACEIVVAGYAFLCLVVLRHWLV
jgi:hypothetical protein